MAISHLCRSVLDADFVKGLIMSDSALLPHILDLASVPRHSLPQDARKMAQLSLFDWMVVSLAGADQPLAHIIRDFVMA